MQNRAGKRQKHICKCRAVKGLAAAVQRGMAAALVFVLCFFMAFTVPAQASTSGSEHHRDTLDYCLRVHDVTVYMSELQGLNDGQKKELVENASGYAFYTWKTWGTEWGDRVSGSGDFSGVNWEKEGTYKITVSLPPLNDKKESGIFYYLQIIDDLPEEPEPEPPAPVTYRVKVRFLDEDTGEPLKEDYVSDEMEEGAPFEIGADILLLPEDYTVAEIQGDLTGEMTSDREILVICRKRESEPQEPEKPEDPENPGDEPGSGDPEEGNTETPAVPGEENKENEEKPSGTGGNNSGGSSNAGSNQNNNSGKNSGKTSGKTTGRSSGSSSGSSAGRSGSGSTSSTSRTSAGQTTKTPSAAAQAAAQAASQGETTAEEALPVETSPVEETVPDPEESALPVEETALPETEVTETEEVPAPAPVQEAAPETDTALAGGEGEGDQSALGGAVITQTQAQKEKYPVWSAVVGVAEAGVLAVLSCMILSDLRLIMWFEKKKRR